MASATEPKTVCVTGATGFIAAFIVEQLLERGHTVHGTVRSLAKADHLRSFAGAAERLKLFEADVTDASSLTAPIAGVQVVLHTATPIVIPMEGEEPQSRAEADEQQIGPALDGVVAVIEECKRAGVKQIVLTSSNAAVSFSEEPPPVVDETCWSDTDWLEGRQQWCEFRRDHFGLSVSLPRSRLLWLTIALLSPRHRHTGQDAAGTESLGPLRGVRYQAVHCQPAACVGFGPHHTFELLAPQAQGSHRRHFQAHRP